MAIPKVSVIIPVYNAEKYLKECLNSILNQTLQEIEIICVDDGSTDSSRAILYYYAKQDARVMILHQKNQYAGVARNKGFEVAKGEYVIFLDADDFFNPELLEKTYWKAKSEGETDVVLFGAQQYDTVTGKYNMSPHYLKRDLLPDKEVFCRKDIPDKFLIATTPCPWTKLFRREFILQKDLKFQPLKNSNDVYFVFTALALAETITYVDEDLVYYRIAQNENTQSTQDKEPTLFLKAYEAVYDKLNSEGIYKDVEKSFTDAALSSCSYVLDKVKNRDSQLKIYKELTDYSFTRMGLLDHQIDYYGNKKNAIRTLGAKYITAWHEKFNQSKEGTFQVLIDSRINNNVLVSVIIPVYNTAPYLEECLDSICQQTLKQIEIICVNDGSPDNSLSILQQYAQKDNRIVVCTQENRGLSATRNAGTRIAKGKYLYFMDSDDILGLSALEILYAVAEKDNLEVLYFDGDSFTNDLECEKLSKNYTEYYSRKYGYKGKVYRGEELLTLMVQQNEFRSSACLQFINRKYFIQKDLWFYEGILHEDNPFNYKCMLSAERVSHIPMQLFHRRVRPGSIMTKAKSFGNAYGYFICYLEMEKLAAASNSETIWEPVKAMLNNSRNDYMKLLPEEKETIFALTYDQRQLFERYVIDICAEKDKVKNLQSANKRYEGKIKSIESKLKDSEEKLKSTKLKLTDTEKKLHASQSRETSLKRSVSFRIGRVVTWGPRKVRGGIRCYKQHGIGYTLKRICWHIAHFK